MAADGLQSRGFRLDDGSESLLVLADYGAGVTARGR